MKLVYKGKFSNNEQLPKSILPENAVKFREPDSLGKFLLHSLVFAIPVFIIAIIFSGIKSAVYNSPAISYTEGTYGILLTLVALLPHELLHAVLSPKEAAVELWYSLKHGAAFVCCVAPVSRARFILRSLLPNLVLGLLPLIMWMFVPPSLDWLHKNLYSFAVFNLLCGIGDYLNTFNAFTQVPRNGIVQNSGINSYWYA